jgi:class 3 adenylate cyclase
MPAAVIATMIVVILAVLCIYDCMITSRHRKLLHVANQTNALISSLFPKEIQKRIFEDAAQAARPSKVLKTADFGDVLGENSQAQLEGMIRQTTQKKKAIADYFPNTSIIFADIVGFTAWSSTRDPSQVFELLETIYHAFDEIARRRKVFKVETIGDCYVAATGLPEQRSDHAVVMARFARDILNKFSVLVRQMEETLGPDTGDLRLRVGINSGPVTAGVLRGERSRFQLFGDTVNTAARMESNGKPEKIHISKETADLLIQAGKQSWVTAREDKVVAKGKGELQTYWLETHRRSSSAGSVAGSVTEKHSSIDVSDDKSEKVNVENIVSSFSDKTQRLIKWNTELLAKSLQIIIARRIDTGTEADNVEEMRTLEESSSTVARNGKLVVDEVEEVINLPQKHAKLNPNKAPTDSEMVQLSYEVVSQLHDFVRTVAAMYREDNPFHNFEHASHVTMSTSKLMSRILSPEEATGGYAMRQNLIDDESSITTSTRPKKDITYGITSDPLTQFAAVFSALIHDVDHPGVPNTTMVLERSILAMSYENKSVAEQNSVDLAWDLFMDPAYEDLRRALYNNKEEFERFRQLVVNLVMATDIMDKDLGADRKARWNKAFADDKTGTLRESGRENRYDTNLKATIVLEHLIQASDVSHTMQHWHIFVKWNERLFHEMYRAYKEGRSKTDPSEQWYQGEIGFFDFYILPLAKKLESCGVFGVSSDEYFQYATNNRRDWELKGEDQVEIYLKNYNDLEKGWQAKHMAQLKDDTSAVNPVGREAIEAQVKESLKKNLLLFDKKLGGSGPV